MKQGCRLARLLAKIQGILFEKQILPYGMSANDTVVFLIAEKYSFIKLAYNSTLTAASEAVFK